MSPSRCGELLKQIEPGKNQHGTAPTRAQSAAEAGLSERQRKTMLLQDEEWAAWADREIARRCAVSHRFVSTVRASLESVASEKTEPRTYTTKHGTEATMRTDAYAPVRQAAKERQVEAGREHGRGQEKVPELIPEATKPRAERETRDVRAKVAIKRLRPSERGRRARRH